MSDQTDNEGCPPPTGVNAQQTTNQPTDELKLRLAAEELVVSKEKVETGRVRVITQTREREALIDENLVHEHAEIETVPIGQRVYVRPGIRYEGDTTIVPVIEEVLYTERRLMLKEEIRITRVRTTERYQERVTLRYQEAVVRRDQDARGQADAVSGTDEKPAN